MAARSTTPRLTRPGIESSERLERHRWVVEHSVGWLLGCRRLGARFERRADPLQGRLYLTRALIRMRFLVRAGA